MKRTPMPPRVKPLSRKGELVRKKALARATELVRDAALERRTPIKPVSQVRAAAVDERAAVRAAVFDRDRRCLLSHLREAGGCLGRLTVHELRKASAARDTYTVDNGVCLCERHNGWVEDWPLMGRKLGLVVGVFDRVANRVITAEEAARRRVVYGLVPRRR